MTVANSLYSDISSYVNTIYTDALLVARENSIMQQLVLTFGDRTGMATRSVEQYGGVTINSIGEDDDLTSQAFTPSNIATLTPAEFGAQYFITDLRIESDPFGVRNSAALDLGQAMGTKIDGNLLGHFNELTAGTIGSSGSAFTWAYFNAMQTKLRIKNAPYPWYFVCTPNQWYRLGAAVAAGNTVTNNPAMQERFGDNFYVGNIGGIACFTSTNCEASSTDAYAAMFSRSAIAFDVRRAPRLEYERNASKRGIELNMSAVFATGVWRATYGCCGLFTDAAITGE